MELSEALKEYRFSLLPPKIQRKDNEQDWKKQKEGQEWYDVQCQVCGRIGAMTIEDMKKHAEGHA